MKTNKLQQNVLLQTSDYSLFESHESNRSLHVDKALFESMRRVGFMPSSPIHCATNKNKKLKVIRGHHRLSYAKQLGLPVYYVIDDSNTEIGDLETCQSKWSLEDFVVCHAHNGNPEYEHLLNFKTTHNLPMGAAASLVYGYTNMKCGQKLLQDIKRGTFKRGDMIHANKVAGLVDYCLNHGISFATNSSFISALSGVVAVNEFDSDHFTRKISSDPIRLRKRSTHKEYLDEIEDFYNFGVRLPLRVPLSLLAQQNSDLRRAVPQNSTGGASR